MTSQSLTTWLVSLLIGWLGPPANDLSFHPAIGSTVDKRFESEWSITIEPLQIWLGSYDAMGILPGGFQLEATMSEELMISDTYLLALQGVPLAFDRRFLDMHREEALWGTRGHLFPQQAPWVPTSDFDWETVRFRAGPAEWSTSLAPRPNRSRHSRAREALPALDEEMDFRYLLPSEPMLEGASWYAPPEVVVDLLFPGGSFDWYAKRWDTSPRVESVLVPNLIRELRSSTKSIMEGHVEITRWKKAHGLVELEIEFDVALGQDFATINAMGFQLMQGTVGDEGLTVDTQRLDLCVTGHGTAFWNVERGRMEEIDIHAEVDSQMELWAYWGNRTSFIPELRLELDFAGKIHQRMQVE